MPQFFSTSPLDYGASSIQAGYAGLGQGIANGINAGVSQITQQRSKIELLKQQQAIEEQQRQTELQRQLQQQAAQYGVQPIVDPATQKFDPYATQAAVSKAKLLQDRVQRQAELNDQLTARNDFEVNNDLAARGLKRQPAPGPIGADTPAVSEQDAAGALVDPRQQIYDYDRKAAADKVANDARLRAQEAEKAAQDKVKETEITRFRQAMGRNPDAGEIGPDGRIAPQALNAVKQKESEAILTPTQRNAMNSVKTAVAAGSIAPEDQDAALEVYAQNGGRAPAMPQTLRDTVSGDVRRMTGLNPLLEKVQQATADGSNPFGQLSFRAATTLGSTFGGNDTERAIEQAYKKVSSGEAFAQGGKQLTKTELDAIIAQIGKPTQSDFAPRLAQYKESVIRDATAHLDQLAQSPYRYTAEGQAAIRQLQGIIGSATEPKKQPGEPDATKPSDSRKQPGTPPKGWSISQ